jgi:hypothetical protein
MLENNIPARYFREKLLGLQGGIMIKPVGLATAGYSSVASNPGAAMSADKAHGNQHASRTAAYEYLYQIGVDQHRWQPAAPFFPVRDTRFFSDTTLDTVAELLQTIDRAHEREIAKYNAQGNGNNRLRIRSQLAQQLPAPLQAALSALKARHPPPYEQTIIDNNKFAFKLMQPLVAAIHELMQMPQKNGQNSPEWQAAQVPLQRALISIEIETKSFKAGGR